MGRLFRTNYFEARKERGFIVKEPLKALFKDGTITTTRALWKDTASGQLWVKLDGEAFYFYPYPENLQWRDGYIRGHV